MYNIRVCIEVAGIQDVRAYEWVNEVTKYLQNWSLFNVRSVSGLSMLYFNVISLLIL
jgi:hypothetical protein